MEGRYAGINARMGAEANRTTPRLVQQREMLMMGLEVQTIALSNFQPPIDLPQVWQRFLAEHRLVVPDAVQPEILYAIYTDYCRDPDRDRNTDYTLIVATEVSSIDNPPERMVGIAIPPSRYLVFSRTGEPAAALRQAWQQVWDYFLPSSVDASPPGSGRPASGQVAARRTYTRAYTIDFERYEPDQISIYIAVK